VSTNNPLFISYLLCDKDSPKEKDEDIFWKLCRGQEKRKLGAVGDVVEHWHSKLYELINETTGYYKENLRISALENEIELLKNRITKLEENKSIIVPIETFAPESYELLKPFHIVLQQDEDEFIASFFEANLGASGDTQGEAIDNLKDIIITTFGILKEHEKSQLGPGPLHQLEVLEEFIRGIP